jgi:C4-dicarboxylate transporter DctM subunit
VSITIVSVLVILLLFLFFASGLEIGFSMALAGFIGYAAIVNVQTALNLVAMDMFSTFSSYGFLVIPLFVLMGQIGGSAGISKNLYDTGYKFLGHIPGGLAIGTVVAATAFKAICGSSVATAATFAAIAIPEMDRYGYDKRLSCGTVATVGTLGVIIPPSVVLIIYGVITETSIGKLFLAGIIPGLMVAFSFAVTLYGWCKINPQIGPRGEKSTWRERAASLPPVLLVIAIFILVVGGLMKGVFSPAEAGSVGTFTVLLLVVAKRDMNLRGFIKSVMDSLRIACMLFMLLVGTVILGHFFAVTKTPFLIADWLSGLPIHRNIILIIICFTFLIGGSFVEDLAFAVLAVPFFLPVVLKLGFDPVYFGVIVCVTSMIGIIIPPMAINVFVVSGITKVPFGTIYKGCYPFIVGMSICLLILLFFPQISLWLPNLLIK